MDNKEYGKYFNNLLVKHGLTKVMVGDELAKRIGIPKSAGRDLVYKYARGTRRPGAKNAVHLSKILNVETEDLLSGFESEEAMYVMHLSNLFVMHGDALLANFNKMARVYDVAKGINPMLEKDEYGRNALDYCWLYRNSEGIKVLIDTGFVEYGDFFSSIHHVSNKNEKIYLTNMVKLIMENNDIELFDTAYPNTNKYEVIETFEKNKFKLYTSFIKEDVVNYFAKNIQKYPVIFNHLFFLFQLNEKDFESRNKNIVSKIDLMKLPSVNELVNIITNKMLDNSNIDPKIVCMAVKYNDEILAKLFKCNIEFKKVKVDDRGRVYFKDDKQKYWLTTLMTFDFEKAISYCDANNNENLKQSFLKIQSQMNVAKYKEYLKGDK